MSGVIGFIKVMIMWSIDWFFGVVINNSVVIKGGEIFYMFVSYMYCGCVIKLYNCWCNNCLMIMIKVVLIISFIVIDNYLICKIGLV